MQCKIPVDFSFLSSFINLTIKRQRFKAETLNWDFFIIVNEDQLNLKVSINIEYKWEKYVAQTSWDRIQDARIGLFTNSYNPLLRGLIGNY